MTSLHPYLAAALGGAMIGLAATLLMLLLGRIAGISGIVGGLLPPRPAGDRGWRLAFIAGLIAGPFLVAGVTGLPPIGGPAVGWPVLLAAGFAVGIGTALGGGCTSGHGICGLARLSPRSLAAVMTFMAVAALTVFVVRHLL